MKLVTFTGEVKSGIGALHPDGFVVDFSADPALPRDMQTFIEAGNPALAAAQTLADNAPVDARRQMADVQLLAPLPRPVRLRDCCLFLEHMEVSLAKIGRPLHPEFKRQVIYYNADHLHVFGPEADIPWPGQSKWIDFELEWACVVGKTGTDIEPGAARDHIFGFTIFNDWSARDLQLPFMEAGLGPAAGKDFANSLGPCIATLSEFEDPYATSMRAYVNGELWSSGTTATMHHRFEAAISQFSQGRSLLAGEVIGSGTVLGGCGFELDRRLAIGDVVELQVDGIGSLRNRVVDA